MNKIQSSLKDIVNDIKQFYNETTHHFLTLNGVNLGAESIEVQWIFSEYGKVNSETIFYVEVTLDDTIPSITDILPSAIISQRELVDMFGLKVEDSDKGLYLDEDSLNAPLGGCSI